MREKWVGTMVLRSSTRCRSRVVKCEKKKKIMRVGIKIRVVKTDHNS